MKKETRELAKWVRRDRGNMMMLAVYLGYATSDTIRKWIERDSIPGFQLKKVMEFIDE